MSVSVGGPATDVLIAHAIVGSDLWQGAPVGRVFGEYTFHLADGSDHAVPIRERFEVGTIPLPWGQYPFLCVPDTEDVLEPRFEGPWERIGFRRTEVSKAPPAAWYLWSWINPLPAVALDRITLRLLRDGLAIAGITIGTLGEEPLRPRTRRYRPAHAACGTRGAATGRARRPGSRVVATAAARSAARRRAARPSRLGRGAAGRAHRVAARGGRAAVRHAGRDPGRGAGRVRPLG